MYILFSYKTYKICSASLRAIFVRLGSLLSFSLFSFFLFFMLCDSFVIVDSFIYLRSFILAFKVTLRSERRWGVSL